MLWQYTLTWLWAVFGWEIVEESAKGVKLGFNWMSFASVFHDSYVVSPVTYYSLSNLYSLIVSD